MTNNVKRCYFPAVKIDDDLNVIFGDVIKVDDDLTVIYADVMQIDDVLTVF